MRLSRRPFLAALAAASAMPGTLGAQPADPRLTERAVGRPDAPVTVQEFFSLTCSHCAAFHRETWPRVKRELVETGTIRMVWHDFPLDRVALIGAMVARSLPPERYEGFVGTLLANQDRWAFSRDAMEDLARMAALAGMNRAQFDAVARDEALARAILEQRATAEREYNVQATPTFVFRGGSAPVVHSGNMPFERFEQRVEEARRA